MTTPRFSLRKKLILSFLVVIVIGGVLSLTFGSRLIKNTLISQAQAKVRHDLEAAWMIYNEKLNDIREIISFTASSESLRESLQRSQPEALRRHLGRVREENGLDILTLTDASGRVVLRARRPDAAGDNLARDELVLPALGGATVSYTQILSPEALSKEGEDLARLARIPVIPTPRAAESFENLETSGMILKAAAPVLEEGRVLGVLYGGILLNRNYEIVDRIKEIVYKGEKYKGRETGTATIFQQDLRISTNVTDGLGSRAIGTRVSQEVSQAVLREGKHWMDRAFVVNNWYITAYAPILDIRSRVIGILYVGMLEKPYIDNANRVMLTFTLMALAFVALLLIILHFSTGRIIEPLLRMVTATEEISRGDLSHKVDVGSNDEIGYLASSFNKMTEDLKTANEKLLDWGKTLEKKVDERTLELREMQSHLVQSEKLASLGKLAAGVAHEINNPLGGILIYSHLLLEDTPRGTPQYDNLRKIVKETTRCKDIVKGLLEFARPREPEMSPVDINHIVDRSLDFFETQALFQNIDIRKVYAEGLPRIVADGAQLQQVFMNIILNAAEAMQGSGILTLRTSLNPGGETILIDFTDNGPGIRREDKKRLFEPFFTTKEVGKGTGLGLAISYSIIRKHEGAIEVSSTLKKGSTFTVTLPLNREIEHDE